MEFTARVQVRRVRLCERSSGKTFPEQKRHRERRTARSGGRDTQTPPNQPFLRHLTHNPRPRKMFRERPRRAKRTFDILPPYDMDTRGTSLRDARLPRRVFRLLVSILISLAFLGLYSLMEFDDDEWLPANLPWRQRLPPLYPQYRRRELALPQHNLNLPYPEGRNGKYVWISEHVRGMSHDTRIPRSLRGSFFYFLRPLIFNRLRVG